VIAVCQSLPGPLRSKSASSFPIFAGLLGSLAGVGLHPAEFSNCRGLGALYVHFGALQPVTAIFYGVSPVVIALILHSCYRLAKLGMEDWLQWCIAGCAFW